MLFHEIYDRIAIMVLIQKPAEVNEKKTLKKFGIFCLRHVLWSFCYTPWENAINIGVNSWCTHIYLIMIKPLKMKIKKKRCLKA